MQAISFRQLVVVGLLVGAVGCANEVMAASVASPDAAGRASDCFCGRPATGGDHCFVSVDCDDVADCGPGDTCPSGQMCLQHDGTNPNCCERKVCVPLCGAGCAVAPGRGTCTNDPPATTFDVCPVVVDVPATSSVGVGVLALSLALLIAAGFMTRRRVRS